MKNEEMAGGGRAHHHKLALVGKSPLSSKPGKKIIELLLVYNSHNIASS